MKLELKDRLHSLRYDLPASVVVFLVALPLCLGIALSSKVGLMSGIVAGVVGALVVTPLSKSSLSVTGPAAGLITIVLDYKTELGTAELFFLAVVLAGGMQVVLGLLRMGFLGNFFPTPVILGMLAAIGVTLILKQVPHAVGFDKDYMGEMEFVQPDGHNTFSELYYAVKYNTPGAVLVCLLSLAVLIIWELTPLLKRLTWLPGALVAVLAGTGLNELFIASDSPLAVEASHRVALPIFSAAHELGNNLSLGFSLAAQAAHFDGVPVITSSTTLLGSLSHPDWSGISNGTVWIAAITIAAVASLESLLSIEAIDKLDPYKRRTPLNRELIAQGAGNMVSGALGGLPVTAVIVRSSANLNAGARSRKSSFLHGILLLVAVLMLARVLNHIPLASLAAILLFTGYKLAKPALFVKMFREGWTRFVPFVVTIVAVLLTDLLIGILIGISVGLFFVLRSNFQKAFSILKKGDAYLLRLNKDLSFLNKATLIQALDAFPHGSKLIINGRGATFIDSDLLDLLTDYRLQAPSRKISLTFEEFSPVYLKKIMNSSNPSTH